MCIRDRVIVPYPDKKGRDGILKVHAKSIPMEDDVDLEIVARGTPGFSGADLANLVNEAALLAARKDRQKVAMVDFEEAKDKVLMGTERRSMIMTDEEKRSTAYHESGHAIVSLMLPEADPIHKVTIIPRGRALGLTQQLPTEDRYTADKDYLLANLAFMLGGRVAEELVFDKQTTGASNDLERATDLGRKMVCEYGMSDELGPLTFGKKEEQIFLGREIAQHRDYSENTAIRIDEEVKKLVMGAHERATKILTDNIDTLHKMAQALLEREVLDATEVDALIKGEELPANANNRVDQNAEGRDSGGDSEEVEPDDTEPDDTETENPPSDS